MFVTLLYCILDLKTGILDYSRAGHLPPILVNKNGKIIDLPVTTGKSLGIFDDLILDQQQCTIPHGGLVLFFSDGLYEAFDPSGHAFGMERLKELLVANRQENATTICKNLWTAVEDFNKEIPLRMTLPR